MSTTSAPPQSARGTDARMRWMDMLRGLAVLLVVVLHAADIPMSNGSGSQEWSHFNRYFEPFRMPLLMLLSGMLLPRALSKPAAYYIRGKLAAVVWPWLLWMVGYGFLVHHAGPGNLNYWLTGGSYLWFLGVLTMCYAVGLAFRPGASRPLVLLVGCPALAAAMLATRHFTDWDLTLINRLLYYGAFFFLGAAVVHFAGRWVRTPWPLILLLAAPAAVLSHYGVSNVELRFGTLCSAGTAVLGLAVLLWAAPRIYELRLAPRPLLRLLEWAGRNSIVIYVVHMPAVVLVHRQLSGLDLGAFAHVSLVTAAALGISLLAARLRPWTGWLYVFPRR
ncbi:acyltransferase family protein [Nesterenkonia populi]